MSFFVWPEGVKLYIGFGFQVLHIAVAIAGPGVKAKEAKATEVVQSGHEGQVKPVLPGWIRARGSHGREFDQIPGNAMFAEDRLQLIKTLT
jgi:hypothetical protein